MVTSFDPVAAEVVAEPAAPTCSYHPFSSRLKDMLGGDWANLTPVSEFVMAKKIFGEEVYIVALVA